MPTATQLGGHRGRAGVQAVSCSGRAAALPRHRLCPTQVSAVPMPSCQGKWMLNKDPNLRVRTQKVLAQSCRVLFRQGQSPRAALPACLGGDLLPGLGVPAEGDPTAAPRSPVSQAGPRLPVLGVCLVEIRTQARCGQKAGFGFVFSKTNSFVILFLFLTYKNRAHE